MNDKKELTINCEKLFKENTILQEKNRRNFNENNEEIRKYETKNSEEFSKEIDFLNEKVDIFIKKSNEILKKLRNLTEEMTKNSKNSVFSRNTQENSQLLMKINELEGELKNYKESK